MARELGMTVGELTTKMTSIEFEEWKIYLMLDDNNSQHDQLAARAEEGLQARCDKMKRR